MLIRLNDTALVSMQGNVYIKMSHETLSAPFKKKKEKKKLNISIPCRLDGKQIFPIFLFNKFIKSNSVWYDFLNLTLLYTFDAIKWNMLHGQCLLSTRCFSTNSHKYNYLSFYLHISFSISHIFSTSSSCLKIGANSVCCHQLCKIWFIVSEWVYICVFWLKSNFYRTQLKWREVEKKEELYHGLWIWARLNAVA